MGSFLGNAMFCAVHVFKQHVSSVEFFSVLFALSVDRVWWALREHDWWSYMSDDVYAVGRWNAMNLLMYCHTSLAYTQPGLVARNQELCSRKWASMARQVSSNVRVSLFFAHKSIYVIVNLRVCFMHVYVLFHVFSAVMLLIWWQEGHPACKNWVVRYWHGYLSGVRCKWFAYGSADATATPSSLAPVKSRMVYLSHAGLPRLSWKKGPLKGCSSCCSIIFIFFVEFCA